MLAPPASPANGDIAPDSLGAYSRRAVAWIEGTYVTIRPSFGDKDAIFAYRTEIAWDEAASSLVFHESDRQDALYTQFGEVAVPNQSGHIYLVTNRHGQHRLITLARLAISNEMYGIITTLLAGRGSLLTPIAAPIAYVPIKMVPTRLLDGFRPIMPIMPPIAPICGGRSTSRLRCFCRADRQPLHFRAKRLYPTYSNYRSALLTAPNRLLSPRHR